MVYLICVLKTEVEPFDDRKEVEIRFQSQLAQQKTNRSLHLSNKTVAARQNFVVMFPLPNSHPARGDRA